MDPALLTPFATWVQEHSGDDQFLSILTEHGFSSELSLGNLDANSLEATELLDKLNYGQKCLLRSLIKVCRTQSCSSSVIQGGDYSGVTENARQIGMKAKKSSIRSKLGQLFHFDAASGSTSNSKVAIAGAETGSDSDDFHPVPLSRSSCPKRKKNLPSSASRAAPSKGKQPAKRKVKEHRLKVVVLPRLMSQIPAPSERRIQDVWVRATANEDEVSERIRTSLEWKVAKPRYLYAQGKNIRPGDVEGADSWDFESIRALMGSGCLYVVKENVSKSSDSETEVSNDT